MKDKSIAQLKKDCWKFCSIYNRRKDADENGYVKCCTCGIIKHWKEGDAGHFLDGRGNGILFEDRGIHFQCKPCNGRLKNRRTDDVDLAYRKYMLKRYGEEVVKELELLRKSTKQFSKPELLLRIKLYQESIKSL